MQHKSPHELDTIKLHGSGLTAIAIVFPTETDGTLFIVHKSIIGDGHSVRVPSKVL